MGNRGTPDRDTWKWKIRTIARFPDARLRSAIAIAVSPHRRSRDTPHAYSEPQVKRILDVLALAKLPPFEALHRHLDHFAVAVGLSIRSERVIPIADRKEDVR